MNVSDTDTEEEIALAIADAINDREWLPVTAFAGTGPLAPSNTTVPVLSGGTVVGDSVTVTNGVWDGNPPPTYTYAWNSDGTAIAETSNTYTLVAADDGATISVTVTATNSEGTASEDSNSIGPITLNPLAAPLNVTPPVVTQTARVRYRGRTNRIRTRALAPADIAITCKWAGVNGNDIRSRSTTSAMSAARCCRRASTSPSRRR